MAEAQGGYQGNPGSTGDSEAQGGYQGISASQVSACDECAALVMTDKMDVHEKWHRGLPNRERS